MKRTLLKIKYENILLLLFTPLAIIQFFKAGLDYKIISIMLSLILYGGLYLAVKISRLEALEELKQEEKDTKKEELKAQIKTRLMFEMLESL